MLCARSFVLIFALLLPAVATPARAVTVTVDTDGGGGSLRQALAAANDGDTIDFALATPATIALTTGELVVGKSVTITGPGASSLTISGSHASRVFHVSPGKTVTIAQLTAAHGETTGFPGGGCFYNENGTDQAEGNFSGVFAPSGGHSSPSRTLGLVLPFATAACHSSSDRSSPG